MQPKTPVRPAAVFNSSTRLGSYGSDMQSIEQELAPLRERLINHEIYERLGSEQVMKRFMEHHIFAVWDFMSLVKTLAQRLTCVEAPWIPVGNPRVRRFVNEIVLEEESDLDELGRHTSHFELYRRAMQSAGADVTAIDRFLAEIRSGTEVTRALEISKAPPAAARFVNTTFSLTRGSDVEVAAAFAWGRELLISPMFQEFVDKLGEVQPEKWALLRFYLHRHIEKDGGSHGPMANEIISSLCGEEPELWATALGAGVRALEARIKLWDEVVAGIAD